MHSDAEWNPTKKQSCQPQKTPVWFFTTTVFLWSGAATGGRHSDILIKVSGSCVFCAPPGRQIDPQSTDISTEMCRSTYRKC